MESATRARESFKTPTDGGTLIFTNTRQQCDALAALLDEKGYDCMIYRGEMDKEFNAKII